MQLHFIALAQAISFIPRNGRPSITSRHAVMQSSPGQAPVRRPRPTRPRPTPKADDTIDDPWSPDKFGFITVGVIVSPHGVHGEMKVRADTDFGRDRLGSGVLKSARYLLRPGRKYPRPVAIKAGRKASQLDTWIIRMVGVASPEEVELLRGARILVKEYDRPPMMEDEFTAYELSGMRVALVDDPEVIIGLVRSVITRDELCAASGGGKEAAAVAADLLEIALGASDLDETDLNVPSSLVPFVKQIVPYVNRTDRLILIDPPAGLLEITRVNNKRKPRPPRGLLPAAKT